MRSFLINSGRMIAFLSVWAASTSMALATHPWGIILKSMN